MDDLKNMWFGLYSRGNEERDSSGFEHVFSGRLTLLGREECGGTKGLVSPELWLTGSQATWQGGTPRSRMRGIWEATLRDDNPSRISKRERKPAQVLPGLHLV